MVVASQSFKLMQERDEEASMKLDRVGQWLLLITIADNDDGNEKHMYSVTGIYSFT
jgi:hypothetical protein